MYVQRYTITALDVTPAVRVLILAACQVGVTGTCMGGALAFAAAQHITDLSAAAPAYGIPDAQYFQVRPEICVTLEGLVPCAL